MFLSILINVLLTLHVLVSLLIILVVLMQRPKSEGLGAAFGGGMTENIFGAQTTNVLAKFTRWLGVLFFVLTLSLAVLYSKQAQIKSAVQRELMKQPAPAAAPATPAASPAVSETPAASATPQASPAATPAPAAAAAPAASPEATPVAAATPAATPAASATPAQP